MPISMACHELAAGGGKRFAPRPKEDEALPEEEVNRLECKVREPTIDLDILHEAARLRPTIR